MPQRRADRRQSIVQAVAIGVLQVQAMTTAPPLPLYLDTADRFREFARDRLSQQPAQNVISSASAADPGGPSDFDLNPGLADEIGAGADVIPAAVLVPVIARRTLTVLFTLRTEHLARHAGQVSFPGGRIDLEDEDAATTALREAEEEIALSRSLVEPLGFLDTYRTSTGFTVAPLVALVAPEHQVRPNPAEVAEIFEVPLAFLLDPANMTRDRRIWRGRERHFYALTFQSRYIWGATAGMIRNMQQRLTRP